MKVAILGYGTEGQSTYKYLRGRNAECEIDVFDQKAIDDADVEITQVDSFLDVNYAEYSMIVRSPSVRPDGIYEKALEDKDGSHDFNFTSATQIFFDKCTVSILGATGTKGKGTTCSLMASILREAGYKVWLVGNIGLPALDVLDEIEPDDLVVYELSSFQLWDIRKSPHVGVALYMELDHQDVHASMEEYVEAKMGITKWQNEEDIAVYCRENEWSQRIGEKSRGKKVPFPMNDEEDAVFSRAEMDEMLSAVVLPGQFNKANAEAAVLAASVYTQDKEAIRRGLSGFTGLPHRLKLVREVEGVRYYNNSIATVPGSTMVDVDAFSELKILIMGGSEKGASYAEVAMKIKESGSVKHVVLIGTTGAEIEKELGAVGYKDVTNLGLDTTMDDIVKCAAQVAESGDVVILSPASASFDMFEGYADRGEKFVRAVEGL
jgi:UDP-N-acetylmuramoylalanine--D-glutamate ligase